MPEPIRAANERLRSRPGRGGFLAAFVLASLLNLYSVPVRAETKLGATLVGTVHRALATLREQEITALTLVLALLGFTLLAIVIVFRIRRSADRAEIDARDEIASLRADVDRLKALLLSETQVLVTWPAASEQPEIIGDTAMLAPAAMRESVLAFGPRLEPSAAQRMEQPVDTLRSDGRGFAMTVTSRAGRPVEAEGRVIAGRAILPLRDVSGIEPELLDLAARHDELLGDVEIMRSLLDTLSAPVWARKAAGRLIFVNSAYARAVEAENPTDAVARELELLDQSARMEVARARATGATYVGRVPAGAAGVARHVDIRWARSGGGGGIAPHVRRDRCIERGGQLRYGHRSHRGGNPPRRACSYDRSASSCAGSACDRCRRTPYACAV